MVEEKEELLKKLRIVKQTAEKYLAENNFDNYIVKNVVRYNKEIELTPKKANDNITHKFHLYVAELENTNLELKGKDLLTELEFLEDENGNLYTISDLIQEYEGFENINEVVEATKENEEKPEEEQEEELKKDSLEELEEEKEKEDENDKKKNSSKEEIVTDKKISNLKGEVDLDQQVNGETLRKILNLGEEYDSIAPVRAASIGVPSNSEYVFVAIKNDKTCTVLGKDIIKEDRQKGTNPDEKDLMVNNDGSLSEESSLANFRIANRPNFVISVRLDEESSTRETTISDVSGRESRDEDVAQELHKDGDERIDDDVRNFIREENGIDESANINEEQKKHEEAGCENDRVENVDEDKSNDMHTHMEKDWKELATKWGYYKDGKPDEEKAKKVYEEYKDNNPHLTDEEVIQEVSDDLYDQIPGRNSRQ